jgi:hypothetical protein
MSDNSNPSDDEVTIAYSEGSSPRSIDGAGFDIDEMSNHNYLVSHMVGIGGEVNGFQYVLDRDAAVRILVPFVVQGVTSSDHTPSFGHRNGWLS